jgi:hypothetical protein
MFRGSVHCVGVGASLAGRRSQTARTGAGWQEEPNTTAMAGDEEVIQALLSLG